MISTLPMVRREFPDYEPERQFKASLPLDHLRITTHILERHALPIMSQYFLRALALEVNTVREIAHLLGLDEGDLAAYGADLLKSGLIEQGTITEDGQRRLSLTAEGQKFVAEGAKVSVLKKRTFHFHYNRLSRVVAPLEKDVIPIDVFRREDAAYVLPTPGYSPTLNDVPIQSVREAVSLDTRQRDEFEVVALLDMQPPYVEYLRGIDVYVLRHHETNERRFAAFKSGRYLQSESAAIQRLHDEGEQIVPDDADSLTPEPIDLRGVLNPTVASAAEEIIERDRKLHDITHNIDTKEAIRSTTQSARERQDLEDEIRRLKDELTQIQANRTMLVAQIQQLVDNAPDFLSTEEHRPLLKRALTEARHQVIIISPWMNLRTVVA